MTHRDRLLSKPGESILVLAAKEKIEEPDFKEVANITERYSGSDLKACASFSHCCTENVLTCLIVIHIDYNCRKQNLCTTTAHQPVRVLIQQERLKDLESVKAAEGQVVEEGNEERVINPRPLNLEDLRQAKSQVAASFATEGSIMSELKQWNDLDTGKEVRESNLHNNYLTSYNALIKFTECLKGYASFLYFWSPFGSLHKTLASNTWYCNLILCIAFSAKASTLSSYFS